MDLSSLISSWPFDPDTPSARIVRAADGSQKLQLRVDLGVLQMELKGRPDGTQPDGFPSVLHYYHDLEKNGNLPSALTDDECAVIHREAMQYFSRLNGFVALEWDRQTYDDAEHILDLLDLVSDLAASDETAWRVNQIYPFVRLQHARAAARLDAAAARFSRARTVLERAIDDIREYYANGSDDDAPAIPGDDDPANDPPEVQSLRELIDSLDSDQPLSEEENLQKALQSALEHENYEKAARLRDTLRRLRDSRPTRSPSPPAKRPAPPPGDS